MAPPRLSHRAVLLGAGSAIQSVGQVGVGLVLVRLLDRTDYGSYRQVWLVLNTVLPFLLLGIPAGLHYFLPAVGAERHRALLGRALLVLSGAGLLFAAGVFLGAPFLAAGFDNPGLAAALRGAALYALTALPGFAFFHFLVAAGRPARAVLLNLAFFALQAAVTLALVARGAPLAAVFLGIGAVAAVRYLHVLLEATRVTRGPWSGDPGVEVRPFLAYALPVGLSNLAISLAQRLDKIVVSAALPVDRFALYAVGAVEFPGIQVVSTAANTVLRPHLSALHHAGDRGALYRSWREAWRKQSLLIVPMAVGLFVLAEDLLRVLYTDDYVGATGVFRVYLFLALFRIAPPEVVLTSMGRARMVLLGMAVSLAGNLALTLVLLRPLGMLGPPVATGVAALVLAGVYARIAATDLGRPVGDLLPLGPLTRVLLPALAAAGPLFLLPRPESAGARLLAGLGVYAAAYLALATLAGAVRRDDWRLAGEWLTLRPLRGSGRGDPDSR